MNVTDEFHKFCVYFHQDMEFDENPIEDAIAGGLANLTAEEKVRLKKFFTDVLVNDLTDDELRDLWFASGADVGFEGPGVKYVMSEALKVL